MKIPLTVKFAIDTNCYVADIKVLKIVNLLEGSQIRSTFKNDYLTTENN